MNYIYHGVPDQMIGTELKPLTQIYETNSELHKKYSEKYKGREELLERRIPLLNCLWNAVVHLSPLHPRKVFELQKELGLILDLPSCEYFEIDLTTLDPGKTVVYFKTGPGEENTETKWLKDIDFATLREIPPATIAYYKSLVGTGEQPFNYQFIPHILYKGSLDISSAHKVRLG